MQWFRNVIACIAVFGCFCCQERESAINSGSKVFHLEQNDTQIKVISEHAETLVTHEIQPDHRPYLHPVRAPNSNVSVTQFSPDHHKHQTGIYWGFTRVNGTDIEGDSLKKWFYRPDKPARIQTKIGRDYFHNPGAGFWKRVNSQMLIAEGSELKWQTEYHLLNGQGDPILLETQIWTFTSRDSMYLLDLEWEGEALSDFVVNEFDYGGLFVRMPWQEGIAGDVVNAARQRNQNAEGQRAMWVDIGMQIEGLNEYGHIAIFDHPDNDGFPTPWRVDHQLGVGPVRAALGDWQIPIGETKTFKHQLVIYSGKRNDVTLNEAWANFAGDHGMYNTASLWGIAQDEARTAKFLTPQEAVDIMAIPDGYNVNVFASEPMITQPMAFCWDDKGRMWIAENRDYESRGSGFANFGDSRILILEDTDRDGVVDSRKVFLEGIPFPSAIAVGFDGLYLGAPPNLLFIPDRDQNDLADTSDIEVLLTGWGIRDRHETINSLHWGPDGWLYGLEGFATPSKIRKPVGKGKIYRHGDEFPADLLEADGVDVNGGVWRYHPVKDRFEVVAHGFSNPWGIDYDDKGQLFISACVIPHLFHVIPGGIYHRQGGQHFNPYVYEDIQTIVDHRHRSAHGGARVYLSDAFPEDQYGRIFMANIHEHAVLSDILHPNGSGFRASHGEDFLLANNAQWIGFSMEIGPEGGLYVLDWHDADICGKEVLHKETGRVFRIVPEQSGAEEWVDRYEDLTQFSDLRLAELQTSGSAWHARRARLILQSRAVQRSIDIKAIDLLSQLLKRKRNSRFHRLRALWSLHLINGINEGELLDLLTDKEEYIRGWAIQLIGEDMDPSNQTMAKIERLVQTESSPVVRMYLAAFLQRIPLDYRWMLADRLLQFKEDANDPNIPFLLWFGIEPLTIVDMERAITLAQQSQIPSISEKIIRRLVDANQSELVANHLSGKQINSLLAGMLAGLNGRTDVSEPENWRERMQEISLDSEGEELVAAITDQFQSVESIKRALETIENEGASTENKRVAITNLSAKGATELVPYLAQFFEEKDLSREAIRALAAYDQPELATQLLARFESYDADLQREVLQTLSSRSSYGWMLANAIKSGVIQKSDVPAYIAVQLRRVVGNGFVEIWGPIDRMESDKQADYLKYQRLLSDEAIAGADLIHGKEIYRRVCFVCHEMHGEGGLIGPELTGSNRTNTGYLLSNILDPSGELQDDYRMEVITTVEGRTYSGNIEMETDRQVLLRTISETVNISKSEIQSRETSTKSLMPEGLLETLTNQEIIDLVAYLKELEPS